MTTLDKLSEQTKFILSKQLETKKFFMDVFQDFLNSVLDEKSNFEKIGQKKIATKLQEIHKLATSQMGRVKEELDKDIEFLEGNIVAVNKIKEEKNPARREELTNLILEDQELPETEQLKIDVESEIEASKEDFSFLINDLKAALQEGEIDAVLGSLQNMEAGSELPDEEEDDEDGVNIFNLPSRENSSDDEEEYEEEDEDDDYEDDEYEDEDECCDEDDEDDECCRKTSACCDEEENEDEGCCGAFPKKGLSGCCKDEK